MIASISRKRNSLKILFIIDSINKLKIPWDTTSYLAAEYQRRNESIYLCEPKHLFWAKNQPWTECRQATINPKKGASLSSSLKKISLNKFNFIWMRKDPPIDQHYLQTCQILLQVSPSTKILNNPLSLIEKNEKLFALEFPQWIPKTIVSRNPSQLHSFLKEHQKVVIKPLHNRASLGVRLISAKHFGSKKNWKELTDNESAYIMAQKYLPQALTQGDKRIVLVDGKPIGVFLRPPTPETLTGQSPPFVSDFPTELTPKEKQLCKDLSPHLKRLGLFFVGIDVIAEKLIEINFTSPAGIPELNYLYGKSFEKEILDAAYRKFSPSKR